MKREKKKNKSPNFFSHSINVYNQPTLILFQFPPPVRSEINSNHDSSHPLCRTSGAKKSQQLIAFLSSFFLPFLLPLNELSFIEKKIWKVVRKRNGNNCWKGNMSPISLNSKMMACVGSGSTFSFFFSRLGWFRVGFWFLWVEIRYGKFF